MKIIHISTTQVGGAGIAARRMSAALNLVGADSTFAYRSKNTSSPIDSEFSITPSRSRARLSSLITYTQSQFIQKGSDLVTSVSKDNLSQVAELIASYDVVHIHAMYNLVGNKSLEELIKLQKLVFVTLHDQRFMTGGCHYSGQCKAFKETCTNCPQVNNMFHSIPLRAQQKQMEVMNKASRFYLVRPSRWLLETAQESSLLRKVDGRVIRNPIPKLYALSNRRTSRGNLGFSPSDFVVGFISSNLGNPVKGIETFRKAMEILQFRVQDKRLRVLILGRGVIKFDNIEVDIIQHDSKLESETVKYMSAMDVLVVPSIQDNAPNVISEAQTTGTAVVGSRTGGIPEMLDFDQNYLFDVGDYKSAAEAVIFAMNNLDRKSTQEKAINKYNPLTIGKELLNYYEEVM
jgi:glycosyltransferase involved in cell wall biosynthesis